MKRGSLVIALLVVCVSSIHAQESTGSIVGTIHDGSGAAITRADVEIRNVWLGRSLHLHTDNQGDFRAPDLLPGSYTVTASASGFGLKTVRVEISLGNQSKIEVTLPVERVTQTLTITEEPSVLDTRSNKAVFSLSRDILDSLPTPRSFQLLAGLAMGAQLETKAGGVQVDGASGAENIWFIDGVDTTGIVAGTSGKNLLVDWVQDLQVKSGGIDAEYGGALGGVINVITKSGTNNMHGELRYYYYGSRFQTAPRPRLRINPSDQRNAEYVHDPKDDRGVNEIGFQLGGPVMKDRFWYFLAYQPVLDHASRTVYFPSYQVTRAYGNETDTQNWTGKLTYQPWERLRANFSILSNSQRSLGVLPSYDGFGNPNGGQERMGTRSPNVTYNADAFLRTTSKLFLNFRMGYFFNDSHDLTPIVDEVKYTFSGDPVKYWDQLAPEFRQYPGWSNLSQQGGTDHNTLTRLGGNADGNWLVRFNGNHNLKFGYQFNRLANNSFYGTLEDSLSFYFDQTHTNLTFPGASRGVYGYYTNFAVGSHATVEGYDHAIYLQDGWQATRRLTLNLGIRVERETVPSYVTGDGIPSAALRFPFSDKIAPRIGFAYDVRGDGKSRVYGSFGKYYDVVKWLLPLRAFGGQFAYTDFYTLDTLDIASIGHGNYPGQKIETQYFFAPPGNVSQAALGGIKLVDPNLKPMGTREYAAGYERRLRRDWTVSLRYTRKRLDRAIEDIGVYIPGGAGATLFTGNPGEGVILKAYGPGCDPKFGGNDCADFRAVPKPSRRYDGLEIRAQGQWTKNWQGVLSYTISRLAGNYSGLASSDGNTIGGSQIQPYQTTSFDGPYQYTDVSGRYIDGPLATDRTHTFKYYGSYRLPIGQHGPHVGVIFTAGSGIPTSRTVNVLGWDVLVQNRNSDGRRGDYTLTNLYVAQDFKLTERGTLHLDFNVDNVFNQSTALSFARTYTQNPVGTGTPGSPLQTRADATKPYDYLKQIQLQADYNRPATCGSFADDPYCPSAAMKLDPTFLKPNAFRDPLSARFGIRISF